MTSPPIPQGFSKWQHKKSKQKATFLTVAKGVGPDSGQDFAYFMAPNSSGALQARVLRMELWHQAMELVEEAPAHGVPE